MPTKVLRHFYGYDRGTRAPHWNASLSINSKYYEWNMDQARYIKRVINIQMVDNNRCGIHTPTLSTLRKMCMLFDRGKEFNFVVRSPHHLETFEIWWARKNSSPNKCRMKSACHPCQAENGFFRVSSMLAYPSSYVLMEREIIFNVGILSDICKFLSFERSCMKLNTYNLECSGCTAPRSTKVMLVENPEEENNV